MKDRKIALLLCFFFGSVGAHKFYLGQRTKGILYALFFWTFIPALIAGIEFWILVFTNKEKFNEKYNTPQE